MPENKALYLEAKIAERDWREIPSSDLIESADRARTMDNLGFITNKHMNHCYRLIRAERAEKNRRSENRKLLSFNPKVEKFKPNEFRDMFKEYL